MRLFFTRSALLVAILVAVTTVSQAGTHVVEMRNADPDAPNTINVFTPAVLRIEPGDAVRFVVIDKGHNTASKKGMIPDGAAPWNGRIDEELELTFEVPGTYGYICLPHYGMGMVGLILVGDFKVNFDEARKVKQRGRARKAFQGLFDEAVGNAD